MDTSAFPVTTLYRFLNDGVNCLVSEIRDRFPLFGMVSTTITQIAGTNYTALPTRFDRLVDLLDSSSNRAYPGIFQSLLSQGFALSDTKLYWVNSDTSGTWTLYYTRTPVEVHAGTASTTDATTMILGTNGAATTYGDVWSGKAYDDYYNTASFFIQSATANGGQTAVATDYDGATSKITVASWPGGTPTAPILYEVMPMLDAQEWKTLLAWEVALRIKVVGRNDPAVMSPSHPYQRERRRLRSKFTNMAGLYRAGINYITLELSA